MPTPTYVDYKTLPQPKSSQVIVLGKCQDNRLTFDNSQDGKGQNYDNIRCRRQ